MGKVRGLGRKLKVEFWIGFYVILDKKFEWGCEVEGVILDMGGKGFLKSEFCFLVFERWEFYIGVCGVMIIL